MSVDPIRLQSRSYVRQLTYHLGDAGTRNWRAARGAVLAVVLSEAPLVGYSVVVLSDAEHEEFRLDLELLSMKPGCGTWQSPE